MKGEIPEFKYGRTHLFGAVAIAPSVADPYVEPLVRQDEGNRELLIVNNPSITRIHQPMLQVYNSLARDYRRALF